MKNIVDDVNKSKEALNNQKSTESNTSGSEKEHSAAVPES